MPEVENNPVEQIEQAGETLKLIKQQISRRIVGQADVVELALTAILSGGHALVVGVPGLAKTRLVDTLGIVLGLDTNRIQFTPDLMPADILGSEVLEEGPDGSRAFRFIEGPVFTQLLMADEINRASPRTQSALLQAMQEGEVTIAGQHRKLARPFHVLATQNPIEQEGTYPLPEAQLDRFLLQIDIDYPSRDEERDILLTTTGVEDATAETVLDADGLLSLQRLVRQVPVGEQVVEAILTLVRAARPDGPEGSKVASERLAWGRRR
jgi:MoxR-like ATPase